MSDDAFDRLNTVAGSVSRETFEKLKVFEHEFQRWATRINLASPGTLPRLWERHILDSAQLLKLAPNALHWLDLGSGGGFPGAVLCILLRERGGARVELVESNNKKAAFLRTTLSSLGCPAIVRAIRIEKAAEMVATPEIVTARALAPLPELLRLSEPWLTGKTRGLFHKGRDYRREVQESLNDWHFDLLEHQSAIDPESVILEIGGLRPIVRRNRAQHEE